MTEFTPLYIKTYEEGKFDEKIEHAYDILKNCRLCPRLCKVNRLKGKKGICNTAEPPAIADYFPHFGEEDVLVGKNGSGTIFISCCNLLCIYCQNASTSHLCEGNTTTIENFAQMMISLQNKGCHNINIVTPTHIVPQLLMALKIAIEKGLHIPLIYNTSGYELANTLSILDGIVDIYMPDFKYWDSQTAEAYSSAKDYPEITRNAIKIMHKQVGDLIIENGIAKRGLLIRHLILPNRLAGTKNIVNFIAKEISPNTYTNIMAQYKPFGLAYRFDEIARPITEEEYLEALLWAKEAGLKRLDKTCYEFLKKRGIEE
ncbi:radical SAM protein [Hippea maritima]|uniref:Radical SAM domain protein n=1 Tax=Hippea maritima (strain ATCC 700847 / DSM 10411 / MH2) TaxID=760142 RepID=F2LWY5_HIPMA|nr:radical SAM protein [Hippea maritima]AEA34169.1 Radical SAM domain protein [Hippea maritima DSM 10411]